MNLMFLNFHTWLFAAVTFSAQDKVLRFCLEVYVSYLNILKFNESTITLMKFPPSEKEEKRTPV